MTTMKYLQEQMPAIDSIIKKAEGRIEEVTGLKLMLDVKGVDDLHVADNQMLDIVLKCCQKWGVPYATIQSPLRKQTMVAKRQVLSLVLFTLYEKKVSLKRMAHLTGLGDHSGFIHNLKRANELRDIKDALFMQYYLPIKSVIDEAQTN